MKPFALKALSAATVAACFSLAPAAQASVLSSYLTFDGPQHNTLLFGEPFQGGGEDKMQDDSLSKFVDVDGSGGYSVGDVIFGMITLSDITASGKPNVSLTKDQVAILFSAKITSLTGGSGGTIALDAIGDTTNTYDLRNLLHSSITSGIDDDTVAVFVSTTKDPVGADDPLNWTVAQFSTDFSNANGWYQELVVGLVGGDDFFNFKPQTESSLTGTDRGVFTIQQSAFPVTLWADVDALDYAGNVKKGDVTLDFGTVNIANATQIANGWTFRDQSTFYINPIPEPGILGLLGMGLLGMGMSMRRRKA